MPQILSINGYEFDLYGIDRLIAADMLADEGRVAEEVLVRGMKPVKVEDGCVSLADWDRESINYLLENNRTAVYKALICLYNRQTADEQADSDTRHLNGRGFNARDARFGSALAQQCLNPDPRYRYPLSDKQFAAARKLLRKYANQLARVANGQPDPVREEVPA